MRTRRHRMWRDRAGVVVAAVIVALLAGATVAVYVLDVDEPPPPRALDGRSVFLAKGCVACHSVSGVVGGGQVGPNLTQIHQTASGRVPGLDAEAYIRQSVLEPQAFIVPGFDLIEMPTLPLNTAELDALVAFLIEDR